MISLTRAARLGAVLVLMLDDCVLVLIVVYLRMHIVVLVLRMVVVSQKPGRG